MIELPVPHAGASRAETRRAHYVESGAPFERWTLDDLSQPIARRFEQTVRRDPGRVALVTHQGPVTYGELNVTANRIAREVLDRGGDASEPVAMLMDKDLPSIASAIALAKAGKIYLPLDPSFPAARLAQTLAECGPRLLLASARHRSLAAAAAPGGCAVVDSEAVLNSSPAASDADDLALPLSSTTLAYILYTSGSTGRPKGVVHSHFGLLHQVMRHTNALRITADDRVTMLGSGGAAQANTQLWVVLLNGATLYPRNLKQEGLGDLDAWLVHNRITCFRSSASLFRHWSAHLDGRTCPALRLIAIGGEPIYRADVELYRAHFFPGCTLVNALSSTETGPVCMNFVDAHTPIESNLVPVGCAVDDVQASLVDETGSEVAPGAVGEFEISSRGLADGYWTRDGLQRDAFLSRRDGACVRTWRMGDVGRALSGGGFVHLGRRDSVVKVSGHRVNLAEIEHALHESGLVRHVAVVDREDERGETSLVAFYVPVAAGAPGARALRDYLQLQLPGHAVPSRFESIDDLPLSAGGKIDRNALRVLSVQPSLAPLEAARVQFGLLGEQLRVIWEDLLHTTNIGPDDDFMELGGTSLLVMDMLLRINECCGCEVQPSRLLEGPLTINRLVALLMDESDFGRALSTLQVGSKQRPLFFLHGDHQNGGFYCRDLARALGADQPFHAVTPHGLDGDELPWSIEIMASQRLAAIRAVQPAGPYRLGGFCTGGMIAFEMARQLEACGEQVETLLMIDTALNNASLSIRVLGRTMRAFASALAWDEATRRRWFLRLRESLTNLSSYRKAGRFGSTRYFVERLLRLPGYMMRPHERRDARADTDLEIPGPRSPEYGVRRRDYIPRKSSCRIALFRSDYLGDQPRAAGWSHFASAVDEYRIAGSHQAIVTRHVAVLASLMRPYLEHPETERECRATPASEEPPTLAGASVQERSRLA